MSIRRIAKPDKIQFVSRLPKTHSGTFGMRRILRKVAENELGSLGEPSTCWIQRWWRRSRGGECDKHLA
ncbi:MAG: hypothetical protein IT227_04475 [Flavobacteriales bacterium]|nr:hypothetical protein [Flavobacteriales bacterium]